MFLALWSHQRETLLGASCELLPGMRRCVGRTRQLIFP